MKKLFPAALLLGWATVTVSAQVSLELVVDQQQFLAEESIPVKVRVNNFSGQALELGTTKDWLTFFVEAKNNYAVEKRGDVPVLGAFKLQSSETGIKRVDLAPYFAFTKVGRYAINASVKIPQWDREWSAKPVTIDIISGNRIWEQDFGVPVGGSKVPEVRKYSLIQALHLKQLKLYLRLANAADTKVIRVYPLGPMVSFSKPEPQMDSESNLHILYQTGARAFQYTVIDPDGKVAIRQTHEYSDTRPLLTMDAGGKLAVRGGLRRVSATDLPPAQEDGEAPKAANP